MFIYHKQAADMKRGGFPPRKGDYCVDGYIKMYRSMLDNPVCCKDPDYLAVWVYLLLKATHKEKQALFKGERVTLNPGQLITGRIRISEHFQISESKVQRILKTFENEQQIEQQVSNKNRLITIKKWNLYQCSEQQNEQQVNNNCTTTEQQVNTNKNEKKEKNVRNNNTLCKAEALALFEELWERYPVKKGKGQVSLAARQRLLKVGREEMVRAIDRYKAELEKDSDWRKPQNGSTFFNSGYVDYLDDNYVPQTEERPKGKANTFRCNPQRDYAFDELEKQLLQREKQTEGGGPCEVG